MYNKELLHANQTATGMMANSIGRFGIVNIWKARKQEGKITDENSRMKAIIDGGNEQERVRQIYQYYNS